MLGRRGISNQGRKYGFFNTGLNNWGKKEIKSLHHILYQNILDVPKICVKKETDILKDK